MESFSRVSFTSAAVVAAIQTAGFARLLAQESGHAWVPVHTAWGHTSLKRTWSGDDMRGVPVGRPKQFGAHLHLTDAEFAAREFLA